MVINLAFSPQFQSSVNANGTSIHLAEIGRFQATGAEISAYDPITKRLFVTGAGGDGGGGASGAGSSSAG